MAPTPLLILSDAPTARTGLARITRDLATRIALDMRQEFRVATIGYGGTGSIKLPFQQYHTHIAPDWIVRELPLAWHDFAGDEKGVVLCIWDASRLGWLVNPPPTLPFADWLKNRPFELWSYSALDAVGPHNRIQAPLLHTLMGFDRVLNYSLFAARATNYPEYLPHGIDTGVFYPRTDAKQKFRNYGFDGLEDDSLLVGIVATNQPRKDWALGIETVARLHERHDVRLWIHTDTAVRAWDLNLLLGEYGLGNYTAVTTDEMPDDQMAELYSACDVTLGIGSGEGFGYPLFESLACGTPVVHGNYGGGADYLSSGLVEPLAFRSEGQFAWRRPVFDADIWALMAEQSAMRKREGKVFSLPSLLDWNTLWPKWEKWLREGRHEELSNLSVAETV